MGHFEERAKRGHTWQRTGGLGATWGHHSATVRASIVSNNFMVFTESRIFHCQFGFRLEASLNAVVGWSLRTVDGIVKKADLLSHTDRDAPDHEDNGHQETCCDHEASIIAIVILLFGGIDKDDDGSKSAKQICHDGV